MRRHVPLVFLVLLLPSLVALGARGQEPPPPPPPQHKPGPYEYKVLQLAYPDFREWPEWKEIVTKNAGNEVKADAAFKEYVLNHFADQGWELVQVIAPKAELNLFYLRRAR